jgi:sulfopyruvate decarboxylase subunit beta
VFFEEKLLVTLRRSGVNVVLTNPCAKIKEMLNYLEQQTDFDMIQVPREDLGVGIAGGAYLAGKRPILFIQSTGLGTLVNAIASLTLNYQFPLPVFCSWRGVIDEPIEAQKRLGSALRGIFESLKVPIHYIKQFNDINTIEENLNSAYQENNVQIFLLSPRLWSNEFTVKKRIKKREFTFLGRIKSIESGSNPQITRYQAIQEIANHISENIAIISNIGFPSRELYSINDRTNNFYMTGSFGLVSAIGLGVSRYSAKDIIVLDGDGSILTNPSILPMVAKYGGENLTIVCLDNGTYGSTGDQPTLTWDGLNLEIIANSFGLYNSCSISSKKDIRQVTREVDMYQFILLKILPGNADVELIPLTNQEIGHRFSEWLLAEE